MASIVQDPGLWTHSIVDRLNEIKPVDIEKESGKLTKLPFCRYAALKSIARDIEVLRKQIYFSGGDAKRALDEKLHALDRQVQDQLFETEHQINATYTEKERERQEKIEAQNAVEKTKKHQEDDKDLDVVLEGEESVSTLRKRLLSSVNSQTELDVVQSTESKNAYQESLQQDLLESLPSMVSGVKEQALQFQDLLKQDAAILKEATENFEKSHGRFGVVNEMLAKYHKEGKLGIFFYIRVIACIVLAFILLVFLIRLIPERH